MNKARLIESIAGLVKEKRITDISDLRDESDRDGMRIVVELKRDANAQVVLNQLYNYTQLQDTVGVIMLALHDGQPKVRSLPITSTSRRRSSPGVPSSTCARPGNGNTFSRA